MISTTAKTYTYPILLLNENWGSLSLKTETLDLGLISTSSTDQENWGLITELVEYTPPISIRGGSDLQINRYEDYGRIIDSNFSIYENYGSIIGIASTTPLISSSYDDYGLLDQFKTYYKLVKSYTRNSFSAPDETASDYGLVSVSVDLQEDFGGIPGAEIYEDFGSINSVFDNSFREDYGSILTATTYEDYGALEFIEREGQFFNAVSDYGFLVSISTPFGSIVSSNGGLSYEVNAHVGTGGIVVDRNTVGVATVNDKLIRSHAATGLGVLSGSAVDREIDSYVGVGTFTITGGSDNPPYYVDYGSIVASTTYEDYGSVVIALDLYVYDNYGSLEPFKFVENVTKTYTRSSIAINDPSADYGLVSDTVTIQDDNGGITGTQVYEDYGSIKSVFDSSFIEDYGSIATDTTYEDNGSVSVSVEIEGLFGLVIDYGSLSTPLTPYGTISISGAATNEKEVESHVGSGGIVVDRNLVGLTSYIEKVTKSDVGIGLGNLSGSAIDKEIDSYVGSGSINVTGGSDPYEDYGRIISYAIYENYGLILDLAAYEDYGSLATLGRFGFVESLTKSYNRSSIAVNDSSADYGLVSDTVTTQDDNGGLPGTNIYEDYGSISSVFDSSFIEDYGSIATDTTYEDNGSITVSVEIERLFGPVADYGSLSTPLTPYGTIVISGAVVDRTELPRRYDGSGTIVINRNTVGVATAIYSLIRSHAATGLGSLSGSAVDREIDSYVGVGTFTINGGSDTPPYYEDYGLITSSTTYEDYGSVVIALDLYVYDNYGSLEPFKFVENVTKTYSRSSIAVNDPSADYGLISPADPIASTDDYGSVSVLFGPVVDYGSLSTPLTPYGTITISSVAVPNKQVESYVGTGGIVVDRNIGGVAIVNDSLGRSHAATGLGVLSGSAVDREIDSYVGSGSINVTGGSDPYEDYGLITAYAIYENYGSIVDLAPYEDYGSLATLGRFGFVESLTKSYNRSSIAVNDPSADYGLVSVSVDLQEDLGGLPGTNIYDDYGSIKSIFDSSFYEDYGSIATDVTYEDNGSITVSVAVEGTFGVVTDYGSLSTPLTPYGTITISGAVVDRTELPRRYDGSGTIVINRNVVGLTSYIEKVTKSDVGVGLGVLSGSAVDREIDSYVGVGTFTITGGSDNPPYYEDYGSITASTTYEDYGSVVIALDLYVYDNYGSLEPFKFVESLTKTYTRSSIAVNDPSADYGFISLADPVTSTDDYGSVSVLFGPVIDYGSLSTPLTPYGTISISGAATNEKEVESHVGSGGIVVDRNIGGVAIVNDSLGRSHAATGLGSLSGSAIDKEIDSYVGSGTINITGGSDPYEDYGLITAYAIYENYGSIVDLAPYEDYGSLATLGRFGFVESLTKSYNRSSIAVNDPSADYGLVSDTVTTQDDNGGLPGTNIYEDYGSIKSVFDSSFNEDYGSIATDTTYEDNGSITVSVAVEGTFGPVADYGSLSTPLTPYGTIVISGSVIDRTELPRQYDGSGTIVINRNTVGVATAIYSLIRSHAATGLGEFTDIEATSRTKSYVGVGTFTITGGSDNPPYYEDYGSIVASTTYEDYGSVLIDLDLYVYDNYGSLEPFKFVESVTKTYTRSSIAVNDPSTDYGLISPADPVTSTDDYGNVNVLFGPVADYGSLSTPLTPYGTISISSAVTNKQQSYSHLASGGIVVDRNLVGLTSYIEKVTRSHAATGLGNLSGFAVDREIDSYVGSGSINVTGGSDPYEDYGFISSYAIYENYGLVLDLAAYEDYGSLATLGRFGFVESVTRSYNINSFPAPNDPSADYGLVSDTVTTQDDNGGLPGTNIYEDYGSISSVFDSSFNEDYGSIATDTTYEDNGSVSVSVEIEGLFGVVADYGSLIPVPTPFGTITISGSVIDRTELPRQYDGSGTITINRNTVGVATAIYSRTRAFNATGLGEFTDIEATSRTRSYVGVGTFTITGGSDTPPYYVDYGSITSSTTYEDYGSVVIALDLHVYDNYGSLEPFKFVESISISYNKDSIVFNDPSVDYGLISPADPVTSTDDYGSVSVLFGPVIDYGSLSTPLTPYGTITISSAVTNKQQSYSHLASGGIVVDRNLVGLTSYIEKVTKSDVGVGLGVLSGSAVDREIDSYVGSGTINITGGSDPYEDYGFISSYAIYENYGSIVDLAPYEDYGSLATLGRFGFVESVTRSYNINSFPAPNDPSADYGLVSVSVDLQEDLGGLPGTNIYDDYGSISSVFDISFYEDYGSIATDTTYEDNGSITVSVAVEGTFGPVADYGSLIPVPTPFGTITISGSVIDRTELPRQYDGSGTIVINRNVVGLTSYIEKVTRSYAANGLGTFTDIEATSRTRSYVGVGTFTITGGSDTPPYYEDYGSINASTTYEDYGSVLIDLDLYVYDNYGSLEPFKFVESVTKTYTRSSIAINDSSADYGLISPADPVTSTDDYGNVNVLFGPVADYGSLSTPLTPYGTITISSAVTNKQQSYSHLASGGIVVDRNIGGVAIINDSRARAFNTTGLGTFTGSLLEKNIDSYVGSGTINITGGSDPYEDYGRITAYAIYENYGLVLDLAPYEDYGLLSTLGRFGFVESVTRSYNINSFPAPNDPSADYGLVSDTVTTQDDNGGLPGTNIYDDYGSISSVFDISFYEDYGSIATDTTYEDNGSVSVSVVVEGTFGPVADYGSLIPVPTPFGTIVISGSVIDATERPNIHIGSGTIVINRNTVGVATAIYSRTRAFNATGLGEFTDIEATSRTRSYVGVGTFTINGGSDTPPYYEDYGSINASTTYEDYGSVLIDLDLYVYDNYGSLEPFKFVESISISYNKDSITEIFENINFGLVNESPNEPEDVYGLITDAPTELEDEYGSILSLSSALAPYGIINISGAVTNNKQIYSHLASGGIVVDRNTVGVATAIYSRTRAFNATGLGTFTDIEATSRTKIYVGVGTFGFAGGSDNPPYYEDYGRIITPTTYDDYGSIIEVLNLYTDYGSLGRFGFVESLTKSYNTNSFPAPNDPSADYGLVSDTVTTQDDNGGLPGTNIYEDYGSIKSVFDSSFNEDYGSIATDVTYEDNGSVSVSVEIEGLFGVVADYGSLIPVPTPFGTINISGAVSNNKQIYSHLASGGIVVNRNLVGLTSYIEKVTRSHAATGLGTFSGNGSTRYEGEFVHVGAGLFGFFGGSDSTENYGSILDSPPYEDNGSVADITGFYEDYGSLNPFVFVERITKADVGIGTINTSAAATDNKQIYSHLGSGTIVINRNTVGVATAIYSRTRAFNATGLGIFSGNGSTRYEAEFTYAGIGTGTFTGIGITSRTFSEVGIGSITISGNAIAISNLPDQLGGTIQINGTAKESITPTTHIGFGTISILGHASESITYKYDLASINKLFSIDYGLITNIGDYFDGDNGSITDFVYSYQYDDYGFVRNDTLYPVTGTIDISGTSQNREIQSYPYVASGIATFSGENNKVIHYVPAYRGTGTINVSATGKESKTPATYIASGSGQFSSIAGKSVESATFNPPDKTVNIIISGAGSDKFNRRRSYTGIGTINISGRAFPVFYTPEYPATGGINISGNATPTRYVPLHTGTGTISIIRGSAESFTVRPIVPSAPVIISGAGKESFAPTGYAGVGTIFISGVGIAVSNPFRAPFVFVTII